MCVNNAPTIIKCVCVCVFLVCYQCCEIALLTTGCGHMPVIEYILLRSSKYSTDV